METELMIAFDCGSRYRLGELASPATAAGDLVALDHHHDNDRYGSINEELAGHGLPLGTITQELFEKHRFACLRLAAESLGRAHLDLEHRFVAAWVTTEDLARYGVNFDETEGLIDFVRRTAEADASFVLKEAPDEGLRVSLRSVTGIDVGRVAARLGRGGHHFMSGFVRACADRRTLQWAERVFSAAWPTSKPFATGRPNLSAHPPSQESVPVTIERVTTALADLVGAPATSSSSS